MSGHMSSFGEFDQCIKIKSAPIEQLEDSAPRYIYGRYCQAQLRIKLPDERLYKAEWKSTLREHPLFNQALDFMKTLGFVRFNMYNINLVKTMLQAVPTLNNNVGHYGVCFPNSCSAEDIQNIFNACKFLIINFYN